MQFPAVRWALAINPAQRMKDQWLTAILFSRNEVGQRRSVTTLALHHDRTCPSGHGYAISNLTFQPANKSVSFCQTTLGNNQSLSPTRSSGGA